MVKSHCAIAQIFFCVKNIISIVNCDGRKYYWIIWRIVILCFCREILADEGKLPLKDLQEQFKDIYDEEIEEEQLKTDLNDLVELTEEEVQNMIYWNVHRDHPSITSSKRWVDGVRKWQFLMIYSTVSHQRGGWVGLKKSKTWWRNTWMVPKDNRYMG